MTELLSIFDKKDVPIVITPWYKNTSIAENITLIPNEGVKILTYMGHT